MKTTRHCILHIGSPKTGSTAIQEALKRERDSLSQLGAYFWQGYQANSQDNRILPRGHYSLMGYCLEEPPLFLKARGLNRVEFFRESELYWSEFFSDVTNSSSETTIVSSEMIFACRDVAGLLHRLLAKFERITVICYLRKPLNHYASGVSQNVRNLRPLATLTPSSWWGQDKPKYNLDKVAEIVGPKNLIVRPFDRDLLVGHDIVQDFFHLLFDQLGVTPFPVESVSANQSLPGAYVAWVANAILSAPAADRVDNTLLRMEVERSLKDDAQLMSAEKLTLRDGALSECLAAVTNPRWQHYLDTYLSDFADHLSQPAIGKSAVLSSRKQHAELVAWIDSYRFDANYEKILRLAETAQEVIRSERPLSSKP